MAEHGVELAKLPTIADLEVTKRLKVISLLDQLEAATRQQSLLAIQVDDVKEELAHLQRETGRPGFRHGALVFTAQPVKGRRTLDKMALLENGCPAAVLNASYTVGEPTVRMTFKRLAEGDGEDGSD